MYLSGFFYDKQQRGTQEERVFTFAHGFKGTIPISVGIEVEMRPNIVGVEGCGMGGCLAWGSQEEG